MVTDLGGFAAATFKGITYINIPTTLLGAVERPWEERRDQFRGYKNEIGAFYPAVRVLISSDFSKHDHPAILSGYAEMVKHALINSAADWEKLLSFTLSPIDYQQLTILYFDR